jgi:hypothetical protein
MAAITIAEALILAKTAVEVGSKLIDAISEAQQNGQTELSDKQIEQIGKDTDQVHAGFLAELRRRREQAKESGTG